MSSAPGTIQKPFIQHVQELRRHLIWSSFFITIGGGIGYGFQQQLLNLLQKPLGQTLYYNTPTGGIAFLFKLCLATGIIFALPAILYNIFRFVEPVLEQHQRKGIVKYIVWSFLLAYMGVAFAYFISLPAALHFLAGFGGGTIKALIGANEYFNFAIAYVAGFAFLFQLPLIILFINRITPLKPSSMMKMQRYVVLISFVVAAILTPTPDPFNQSMMAVPIIVLYQVGIIMVMLTNHATKRKHAHRPATAVNQSIESTLAGQFVSSQKQDLLSHQPIAHNKRSVTRTTQATSISDISLRRTIDARTTLAQPSIQPLLPSKQRLMVGNDFS